MKPEPITIFCPRCGMPVRMEIVVNTTGFDPFEGGRITASVTVKPTLHRCAPNTEEKRT